MGWMAIWWLLVPVLIAVLLWGVLRSAREPSRTPEPPEEIVKRRYARGEIDRDTYERLLSDLKRA
jgi:putative membrane protein